ncbi:MAG: ATP-grasp domain-containing protein [Gammaproteobacteria bacterium]|nr:ATP-grasp domain-containing protein [Gammaproteobacteria bacterium]
MNAAKRLGLNVLIASEGKYSLISEVYDGLHIDLDDHSAALNIIIKESKLKKLVGVLGSDDSTVELAAKVARELKLPHNPPNAARLSMRKDLARAHLSLDKNAVPDHCLINLNDSLESQIAGLTWPRVIKPLHLSASRGVIRVNNKEEFFDACYRVKDIINKSGDDFECSHILIEEYIDGREVAFEGYLENGKLHTLVIFDKPDPLTGPFFEETIYVTPSSLDQSTQMKIKQRVEQACQSYGLTSGPIHAELRVNESDAYILEVASRTIGGDCARSLDSGNDFNLEELVVSLAVAKKVTSRSPENARGVMMIPIKEAGILRRVEGLAAARKTPHVDKVDIIIREGNELIPLPEGNQYPGYIFAQAKTSEEVVTALKTAYEKLNFVMAPAIKLHKQ